MKKLEIKKLVKNIFPNSKSIRVVEEYELNKFNVELKLNGKLFDINIDCNGRVLFIQELNY